MPKTHSLDDARSDVPVVRPLKTAAERHAELERAGLIHRVEFKPGQAAFPLGVRRPGALKRFLADRA